jgi:hypothetical protein
VWADDKKRGCERGAPVLGQNSSLGGTIHSGKSVGRRVRIVSGVLRCAVSGELGPAVRIAGVRRPRGGRGYRVPSAEVT